MFKIISPLYFNTIINGSEVANQIAALLNQNNNLSLTHSINTITTNGCLYLVYIQNQMVVGCTGLRKEEPELTRNMHTSVAYNLRKKGLGKYMVWQAMCHCATKYMFVTIRDNNHSSLRLYYSLGFDFVESQIKNNHKLLVLGRKIK